MRIFHKEATTVIVCKCEYFNQSIRKDKLLKKKKKTSNKLKEAIYKRKKYTNIFFENKAAPNRKDSRKQFGCQRSFTRDR